MKPHSISFYDVSLVVKHESFQLARILTMTAYGQLYKCLQDRSKLVYTNFELNNVQIPSVKNR